MVLFLARDCLLSGRRNISPTILLNINKMGGLISAIKMNGDIATGCMENRSLGHLIVCFVGVIFYLETVRRANIQLHTPDKYFDVLFVN